VSETDTDIAPSKDAAAPQLLFVDADIVVRSAIASYLRECGYSVVEAASIDEAMTVLGRLDLDIDIVVADVDTPGSVDGFGLARWIAEHRPGVHVALSATVQRAAKLASELCKDGPHLNMPYNHAALLDYIKRLRIKR
jgi:CheY-like chemotaxis protein